MTTTATETEPAAEAVEMDPAELSLRVSGLYSHENGDTDDDRTGDD